MKTQKALSLKKETVEILQSNVYGFGGAGTNQINSKAAGTVCISCDRICPDSKGQEFCQTKPVISIEGTCIPAMCQSGQFGECAFPSVRVDCKLSIDGAISECLCLRTEKC